MTIEHLFEFLLLFSILLHVLPEREHFGHIFYLNPNSRTFHEISGENIKFKVISRFFTHFSNSRLFPGYPGISGGRGDPEGYIQFCQVQLYAKKTTIKMLKKPDISTLKHDEMQTFIENNHSKYKF